MNTPNSATTDKPSPYTTTLADKPVQLAVIRQKYTPYGGAEKLLSGALRSLGKTSSVTVITRKWEPNSIHKHQICNPLYVGSLWRDWSFSRCICRLLKNHSFDLIQSHERISCCDIYRAGDGVHREWLEQRLASLNLIERIKINLNPYHLYMLATEKRLFASKHLKAVICISEMVKNDIQRHYNMPDEKLHVIYNGVDSIFFNTDLASKHKQHTRKQWNIPHDSRLFLFVGSGFYRKGLDAVLRATAILPTKCHLLVVGKDKHLRRYQNMANQLQIGGRVHFTGGQRDVRPFYGASDALVFPSLYEPFGNVVLEAMACGLPVIVSSKSGAAEIITEGQNGAICTPNDHRHLAKHMMHYLSDDVLYNSGMKARLTVSSMTFEAMNAKWTQLYFDILNDTSLQ